MAVVLPDSSRTETIDRFARIRRHARHGVVAPNKPLTLLWALGRLDGGGPRLTPFAEAEAELRPLLDAYGTPGTPASCAFWRLQHDGLWEVVSRAQLPARSGNKEPRITALRAHASGGFERSIHRQLRVDPGLRQELSALLADECCGRETWLDRQAPPGRPAPPARELVERAVRRAAFRREVMDAYGSRCVVCGWDLVHAGRRVGLDAAHVRPHSADGPDTPDNGFVLCSLHHDLFDAGLFTYDTARRLVVSASWPQGENGAMRSLRDYADRMLPEPRAGAWRVHASHLAWHRRHVFVA